MVLSTWTALLINWRKVVIWSSEIVTGCQTKISTSVNNIHRKRDICRNHIFKLLQKVLIIQFNVFSFRPHRPPWWKPSRVNFTIKHEIILFCQSLVVINVEKPWIYGQNCIFPKQWMVIVSFQNVVEVEGTAHVDVVP